ncbi:hypothetical protein MUK70_19045 [Dyadobacter chenwenxiniae]|uniref:DUF3991 domain-containing protein n=1 Tax=Dyadobacter chenwenxiniae TaxID=2906456 RepID=A0A9X1PKU5_9BACT|nr:hypothetical protein [Dyadobacter chenwenxiniae]MCF0061338.1 hypothetical protein [Dyadobacter chenwenxiniae]UON81160.1 hypothetical protein MUK70_19045 [Dyadobacter chenwenxiniae]
MPLSHQFPRRSAMDKDHADSIPISKILDKLQIKPQHIGKSKALYRSPITKEQEASFWVYFKTNSWYDYAIPTGGTLDDFVQRYLKFTGEANTPVDVLRWIGNMANDSRPVAKLATAFVDSKVDRQVLFVKSAEQIRFLGLIKYLEGLSIPVSTARLYAKELKVLNRKSGRTFIAIGTKNENDGYELRNPFFNGSVQPGGITFFRGTNSPSKGLHIFKDIFDFLSILTQLDCQAWEHDTIVLHAHSNAAVTAPYIQHYGYKTMYTWMDNDLGGQRATRVLHGFIRSQPGLVHLKMNRVYEDFLSVNAWHVAWQADKNRLKL